MIIIAILSGLFVGVIGGFMVADRDKSAYKRDIENIIETNKHRHDAIILNYVKQYLRGL